MKELSYIYHDRPVKPGQSLIHWVRHVVQTRGALHLRSPALKMPFYQRLYLDLLCIILVVLYIVIKFMLLLYAMACAKKESNIKKKTN